MPQSHADTLFIQFAKEPIPGQVKTRMMPYLNAQQACELHRDLLLWTCCTLTGTGLASVELWVSGNSGHRVFTQCADMGIAEVKTQQGADLGERMYHAIYEGLKSYRKVILVGSDCPGIDAGYLNNAIAALDQQTLVLGPASDGGYVLIGATEIWGSLFERVSWGGSEVLAQTKARIATLGEQYFELNVLADIDRPEDLALWQGVLNNVENKAPK